MRYLRLAVLAGLSAVAACNDKVPGPTGPNTSLAFHFDSLSSAATKASENNRATALNLALRVMADGGYPGLVKIADGTKTDTATYETIAWSIASVVQKGTVDSVTDSLMVIVGWRGINADSLIVLRVGTTGLAPNVQNELATLGLTFNGLSGDSLVSAALVTGNNTVTLADSGAVTAQYGVLGQNCEFITVTSIANDSGSGTSCQLVLIDWGFTLRFSPSSLWGVQAVASPGVVIIQ